MDELNKEKIKLKQTITLAKQTLKEEELGKRIEKQTDDEYLLEILGKKHHMKIKSLQRATQNPYFARIDFKENKKEKSEVYIGKTNLFD